LSIRKRQKNQQMTEAIMAVWTTGSARRRSAFWVWAKRLLPGCNRPAALRLDDLPDALSRDVAAPQAPLPNPRDDVWARIAAAKLPRF
jgi:hypothetical protein